MTSMLLTMCSRLFGVDILCSIGMKLMLAVMIFLIGRKFLRIPTVHPTTAEKTLYDFEKSEVIEDGFDADCYDGGLGRVIRLMQTCEGFSGLVGDFLVHVVS